MTASSQRRISIVIPILNAKRTVGRCLEALEALDPAPDEIILVDNGSVDGSLEILEAWVAERPSAHLVREAQRGASAARNRGVSLAEGELIAFTDSDCVPHPDWLWHLAPPFADAQVGAVAGAIRAGAFEGLMETFNGLYTLQSPDAPSLHQRWTPWEGGFPTANLAIRKALFDAIGGFDESVRIYGEDYDLCARVYAAGKQIAYENTAAVAHYHRVTLRGLVRQAFGFGRAHAYLMRRRHVRGLWLQLPGHCASFERTPLSAWIDLAGADKKLIGSVLAGIIYPALFLLPLVYIVWLAHLARRRVHAAGLKQGPAGNLAMAGLLLVKSASMTAGRTWGSLRYGVICI